MKPTPMNGWSAKTSGVVYKAYPTHRLQAMQERVVGSCEVHSIPIISCGPFIQEVSHASSMGLKTKLTQKPPSRKDA